MLFIIYLTWSFDDIHMYVNVCLLFNSIFFRFSLIYFVMVRAAVIGNHHNNIVLKFPSPSKF